MPVVRRFEGFRVDIRSRDHAPPHVHVIGPDFHALVRIADFAVLRGTIPRKVHAAFVAWATGEADALMAEWRRLNERD